jgi:TATA-binding protein-associated factor Taf7
MKYVIAVVAILCATITFADTLSDRISELEKEIAERKVAISELKQAGKPTGRFEMTVLRLEAELAKRKQDQSTLN